ncbi:MAG: 2Fe-2S iron-sulfur cluster-binding protein [Colwellia sp.]|nr:2Fe-2S iron-sulfur cluster-binding protein [Colwellia sp.]
MAHQYAKTLFTKTVRQVQSEQNSRTGYKGMDVGEDYNFMLSETEADFIGQRDSFYMASVSETQWPYVQHRGGIKGFLKVLDSKTLGFADYKGNRQYISTGNFRTNDRVSIILVDYPNRRRLKLIGRISVVDEQDWQTLSALEDNGYRARVERGFTIKITAFDWNCPQHITPRYSESELSNLIEPLEKQINALELKLEAELQSKVILANSRPISETLGDGELSLVISGIRQLTPEIRAYELRRKNNEPLPKINAGAHIQVPVILENKQLVWRNYSISSNPERTDSYEIAVKKEQHGSGGSQAIHQSYQLGITLNCKAPRNNFSLNKSNSTSVLIAAGIGITPIKSMALALLKQDKEFELHFAGRTEEYMAYADRLSRQVGDKLHLYISAQGNRLSFNQLMANRSDETNFYFCGPASMLNTFKQCAIELGISSDRIHFEQFNQAVNESARACQLTLTKSNVTIDVNSEQTLLDAVLEANVELPYSCMVGECKSCVVNIPKDADVEHLDSCLTDKERTLKMCLCVSRPRSKVLAIEL